MVETNRRSTRSKVWIALSFTLSALILGWAFSIPFQQSSASMASSAIAKEFGEALDRSAPTTGGRSSGEEFRQAAIELDKKFMQSLQRHRERANRPRPGINESRVHWQRRMETVSRQLENYRDAEKGSVEWEYKQSLLKSLEDRPR